MKNTLSYLLLFVYATIMVKPVMPTIADVFAHLLNYKEHIATVHQEHGKFHVHYDYMQAAKKDSHENSPYSNTSKKSNSSDDYVLFVVSSDGPLKPPSQIHLSLTSALLPNIAPQGNLRPPISFPS